MVIGKLGAWLRVAVCLVAVALAACMPFEPPRLGAGPPVITLKEAGKLGSASARGEDVRLGLEPLTNAPADMLFAFEDRLKALAPTRHLKIVPAGDPTAHYRLKGYLSAVGDSTSTLMVYVWDVFDASGTRVHRFSGQVRTEGDTSDPWTKVDANMINTAAGETIDDLGNWIRS